MPVTGPEPAPGRCPTVPRFLGWVGGWPVVVAGMTYRSTGTRYPFLLIWLLVFSYHRVSGFDSAGSVIEGIRALFSYTGRR